MLKYILFKEKLSGPQESGSGYENDSLVSSSISIHNENESSNQSYNNTIDDVAKSFANAISVGERYLGNFFNFARTYGFSYFFFVVDF